MRAYKDKTADTAYSNVNKEWREMASIAYRIRTNNCSPNWADQQLPRFTGIYKRLLTDPLEEVQQSTHK